METTSKERSLVRYSLDASEMCSKHRIPVFLSTARQKEWLHAHPGRMSSIFLLCSDFETSGQASQVNNPANMGFAYLTSGSHFLSGCGPRRGTISNSKTSRPSPFHAFWLILRINNITRLLARVFSDDANLTVPWPLSAGSKYLPNESTNGLGGQEMKQEQDDG